MEEGDRRVRIKTEATSKTQPAIGGLKMEGAHESRNSQLRSWRGKELPTHFKFLISRNMSSLNLVLCEATKLVLICYSSNKTLIKIGCEGGSKDSLITGHLPCARHWVKH